MGALLDAAGEVGRPSEGLLRQALNEGWFSGMLAWLLDPRGDHGLGVRFVQEFLKQIARERSEDGQSYARLATHLKWSGAAGPGKHVSKLRLGNASSLREFYLARAEHGSRGDRYADVVLLDLDTADGVFLVVENKLFGTDSQAQLSDLFDAVESRYQRARIREYVYLTLNGVRPTRAEAGDIEVAPHWVSLSWTGHVLAILEKLAPEAEGRVGELMGLLRWLARLRGGVELDVTAMSELVGAVVRAASTCLLEELNRLADPKHGAWSVLYESGRGARLRHSSSPKRTLQIQLLPSCSLIIQSRYRHRARCDKLLVPFGAPARQVFNLLHVTARDIYYVHFDKPSLYLRDSRRRTRLNEVEHAAEALLNFVWRRRFELQATLGVLPSLTL